jgi:hypothetical protein
MKMRTAMGWLLGLAMAGCIDDGRDGDVARTAQPLVEDSFELVDLGILRTDHGVLRLLDNCMLMPEDGQTRLVYFNPARGSAKGMYIQLRDGFGADATVLRSRGTSEAIVELELEAPLSRDRPVQLTVWEGIWQEDAPLPWAGGFSHQVGQRRSSRDAYDNYLDFDAEFRMVDKPCFPTDPGECVPLPPPPCPRDPWWP